MLFRSSIQQARRAPVRMILCFVLMALVCAFLTLGLNLRASTKQNLEAIYESYEVIAVPSFQAYVDRRGRLTEMGWHEGYLPCAAENYDLTPIREATGVESVDVRNRFGAYVHNEGFERRRAVSEPITRFSDVIRFVYTGTEPLTLEIVDKWADKSALTPIPMEVTWSAAGYSPEKAYPETIPSFKLCGAPVTLIPGTEYIATVGANSYRHSKLINETAVINMTFDVAWPFSEVRACYDDGAHWEIGTYADFRANYEPIAEYTEDFWETEQGQLFAQAAECCYYDIRSVNAVTTNDLMSALPFYKGNMRIEEGRGFSQEDYDNGNAVCLVSSYLAKMNHWQIGDKIQLSFFENDYMYTRTSTELMPHYAVQNMGFFSEGTYEIIGFYDGLVTTCDYGDIDYHEEIGVLWMDIFLPEKSVENAPAPKLSNYNTTIRLETLSGMKFLADMEDSGLTQKQENGYQVTFTLHDQGISVMADGLQQLSDISTLTVALSVAASLLSVVVLVVFHLWRSKKEIACLRSLGVRKGQVLVVVLAGLLLASALGCAAGAALGNRISVQVAERIMAAAAEDLGDTTFTVNTSKELVWTKLRDFTFHGTQQTSAAVFSALGVMAVMCLFSMALTWWESRKPPLLQLGRRE